MINKKHHDVSSNKDCLKILRETSKNFFNILWKCKWIAEEFRLAKAYRIFLLDLVSLFAFLSLDIPSPPRFPTSLDFYTFLCRFAITILTSLQKPRNIYRRKNARKYANSVRSERKNGNSITGWDFRIQRRQKWNSGDAKKSHFTIYSDNIFLV